MKTDIRAFVLEKFKHYSSIDAEEDLIPIVLKDFTNEKNKVTLHDRNKDIGTYISVVNKEEYPYLIIHMDRVPLVGTKLNILVTENTITAQLDNLISVAVAKFLFDNKLGRYNILFTTREEQVRSYPQIKQYLDSIKTKGITLIDLDIDKIGKLSEIPNGQISLREKDLAVKFDERLVSKLQRTAMKHKVPFLGVKDNEKYPVNTQMGFLIQNTSYRGAFLGMPIINLHSGTETTYWRCIENAIKLLTVLD